MSFSTGCFARAARPHEAAGQPCQDACAAQGGAHALALVCDGCSDAPGSELVSMALSRSALSVWREGHAFEELGARAWARARAALAGLGVEASLAPSTLLALSASDQGGKAIVQASLWGDGVVAWGSAAGVKGVWVGKSPSGRPCYPAYAFDEALWEAAIKAGAQSVWAPMEGFEGGAGLAPSERGWRGSFELEPGEIALALSDGALAVAGVDLSKVLGDLLRASGPGEFIQRRARAAAREWMSQGARLEDDFGVAAIRWEPSD